MKKIIIYSALCLPFAACVETNSIEYNSIGGEAFEEGQKVVIGMSSPSTKFVSEIDDSEVRFTWEEKDSILIKVGKATSLFGLKEGAGTSCATFEGTMPAAGTEFTVQFPPTLPILKYQDYAEGQIPKGKLVFLKENCSLGQDIFLGLQNAVLNIPLYGTSKTVGKIQLSLVAVDETRNLYLTCSPAKTIGTTADTATPFFIVVPVYQKYKKMTIKVFDPEETLIKQINGTKKYFEENMFCDLPPLSID